MTTTTITKISEALEKAADAIEQRGWIKGAYGDLDYDGDDTSKYLDAAQACPVCAAGAIRAVATDGDPYNFSEFSNEAYFYVGTSGLLPPEGRGSLITFNDEVAESKEQVTELLRKVAQKAKEEGR